MFTSKPSPPTTMIIIGLVITVSFFVAEISFVCLFVMHENINFIMYRSATARFRGINTLNTNTHTKTKTHTRQTAYQVAQ